MDCSPTYYYQIHNTIISGNIARKCASPGSKIAEAFDFFPYCRLHKFVCCIGEVFVVVASGIRERVGSEEETTEGLSEPSRCSTHAFLKEQNHELADRFRGDEWIAKLLFLADVFSHVNQLNSSMQGKEKLFFDVLESIDALKGKIKLWMHRMKSGRLAAFPGLNLFVEEKDISLGVILPIFLEHLNTFLSELNRYIPSNDYCRIFNWVRNPFQMSALEVHSDMDCIA